MSTTLPESVTIKIGYAEQPTQFEFQAAIKVDGISFISRGDSVAEAIGHLVMNNQKTLNIKIEE